MAEEVQQAADDTSSSQPGSRRTSFGTREQSLTRGHWLRPQLMFSGIRYDSSFDEPLTEVQASSERWLMRGRSLRSAADGQQLQLQRAQEADAVAEWQQKMAKLEAQPSASVMLAVADSSPSKPGFFISR